MPELLCFPGFAQNPGMRIVLVCALLVGCSSSDRGTRVPPADASALDAGLAAEDDAGIECLEPGADYMSGAPCCFDGVCTVDGTGLYACAERCRSDFDCYSGCCAPLLDGTAAVCSPLRFCDGLVRIGDVCNVYAVTGCDHLARCGSDTTGCVARLRAWCCGDSGDCEELSRYTPVDLRECIVVSADRACDDPAVPIECQF